MINNNLLEWLQSVRSRFLINTFLPVFLSTAILAVFSFAGNILVQQKFSTDDVGLFTLIVALISTIGPISQFGQGGQILRKYSGSPVGSYNWPRDLLISGIVVAIIASVLLIIVSIVYSGFSRPYLTYILISAISLAIIGIGMVILQSNQYYFVASIMARAPFALILPVLFLIGALASWELHYLLLGLTVSFIVICFLTIIFIFRRIPIGTNQITMQERFEGTNYILWTVGEMLSTYGEVSVAGLLLNPAAVATYGVTKNLTRIFDLLRSSMDTVLPTEIARRKSIRLRQNIVLLIMLVSLLIAFHIVILPRLIGFFFDTKYELAPALVWPLTLAAAFKTLHSIPHSMLIVDRESIKMKRYLHWSFVFEVLSLLIIGIVILSKGVIGLAVVVAILWFFRITIGVIIQKFG